MEFTAYLGMILRNWWIVILTTLAAVAIALAISFVTTPMYRASASFVVSPNKAIVANQNLVDSLGTLDKRSIIATYAEVVNSNRIFGEATTALQINAEELKNYTHSTVVLPDANVLVLAVSGPDPQRTALLANSMGQRAINYVKGLYQAYDITLLDPAVPPLAPYSPQPLRDTALAAVLGLVIGSVLAVAAGRLQASERRGEIVYSPVPAHPANQYLPRR